MCNLVLFVFFFFFFFFFFLGGGGWAFTSRNGVKNSGLLPTRFSTVLFGFKQPELESKCGPWSQFSCLAYKETDTSSPRTRVRVLDLGHGNGALQFANSVYHL